MKRAVRCLCLMLLAVWPCALSGCWGAANPSYFPYLFPPGRTVPTHAKPPGSGYYANFDPHALRLEIRDNKDRTRPVRTEHVLIATIYDEKGQPRRGRRVEWLIEGVGHIIEADESGNCFSGRGLKVNEKYAVTYTNLSLHRLTRGNVSPSDDFVINAGQSWCAISSPVEGDTHVTVFAPEIHNWEKNKVFVNVHWVDAGFELPPPAAARTGTEHVFTTRVYRHTDKQPLANYRVRYRILDGPPAVFLPSRTQEAVAVSDLSGNAHMGIAQAGPALGLNRIGVEIIRPPDPTAPSGSGIPIGQGETSVEWLAPAVSLAHTAPPSAVLGSEVPITSTVSNVGKIESRSLTLTSPIPEGLQYLRSQPPAFVDGRNLTWTFGLLPAGQAHTVQAVFKALRPGLVTSSAVVVTEEGLRDEKQATTTITTAALKVAISGPPAGAVGLPLNIQVAVTNPGNGPLSDVRLSAVLDPGLEEQGNPKIGTLNLVVGSLGAQETKNVPLVLVPQKVGALGTTVTATAESNLSDQARHVINVQQPQMSLAINGPKTKYVGREGEWTLQIANAGDVPLHNVVVRDRLPPELVFVSATQPGQLAAGEVVWNVGNLQPREQRLLQVTARCQGLTRSALHQALATADPGLRVEAQATVEILGIPALRLEMRDQEDPVELGKRVTYLIDVTNTGSLPANEVEIKAILPPELKLVRAKGPSAAQVNGQEIVFAKVSDVKEGQTLKYTIEAEALKPGDVRFRVELRAQTLQQPVLEEEPTRIYNPAVPPPPPPPGGGVPPAPMPPGPGGTSTGRVIPLTPNAAARTNNRPPAPAIMPAGF